MKIKRYCNFELSDSSPWPFLVSIAIFIIGFGLVSTMHRKFFGFIILIFGILTVLYALFFWWSDLIKESFYSKFYTKVIKNSFKIGMYLFILSEAIFFMVLFCSLLKSWFDPVFLFEEFSPVKKLNWPPVGISLPNRWSLPLMNTLILLLSGTTVNWAHYCLLENNKKFMIKMLLITILLGLFFIIIQTIEYRCASFSLKETGEKLIYSSYFYIVTGFHCFHVIIGLIFLLVCLFRALKNQFTPDNHLCFKFASWYWHFIDVIWVFLFIFIY